MPAAMSVTSHKSTASSAEAIAAIEQLLEDLNAVEDDGFAPEDGVPEKREPLSRKISEATLKTLSDILGRITAAPVKGSIRIHNGTGYGQEDTKAIMIDGVATARETILLVLAKFNDASLRELNPLECSLHWISGGLTDTELDENERPLEYRQRLAPDAIVLDRDRFYLRSAEVEPETGEIPVQFTGRWHSSGLLSIHLTTLNFTPQVVANALQSAAIHNDVGEVALTVLSGKEERVLGVWEQPLLVQRSYDGKAFFRLCPKADLAAPSAPAAVPLTPVVPAEESDGFRARSKSALVASGVRSIINETAKDFRRRTASLGEVLAGKKKEGKAEKRKSFGKIGEEGGSGALPEIPGSPTSERSQSVFGAPLDRSVLGGDGVPSLVTACIRSLEMGNHLGEEGIYRVSAAAGRLAELRKQIDDNPRNPHGQVAATECPNVVTNILKCYLRELPEHVLTDPLKPHFAVVASIVDDNSRNEAMRKIVLQLPTVNRRMLGALFAHLRRVLEREADNKMPLKNLGIVFCPTLQIPARLFCIMMEGGDALFADP